MGDVTTPRDVDDVNNNAETTVVLARRDGPPALPPLLNDSPYRMSQIYLTIADRSRRFVALPQALLPKGQWPDANRKNRRYAAVHTWLRPECVHVFANIDHIRAVVLAFVIVMSLNDVDAICRAGFMAATLFVLAVAIVAAAVRPCRVPIDNVFFIIFNAVIALLCLANAVPSLGIPKMELFYTLIGTAGANFLTTCFFVGVDRVLAKVETSAATYLEHDDDDDDEDGDDKVARVAAEAGENNPTATQKAEAQNPPRWPTGPNGVERTAYV